MSDPLLSSALNSVGVDMAGATSLSSAIDQFTAQNISVPALSTTVRAISDAVSSSIPTILRLPPTSDQLTFQPSAGEWTSLHYADDLIPHAPKFKFLFKVSFIGFGATEFQYYVHRCDKPKVVFNHMDVNYYNFRTRVLTSLTFQPLSMTLLDETGNSVNQFFAAYLASLSGQGQGNASIDDGFGKSSSTTPYEQNQGYSAGKKVVIEQIFANGIYSNLFELVNPRIEGFDFDELNMEDSSTGSLLNIQVSYDALKTSTVKFNELNTWGNTDIRAGGGSSGVTNAGSSSSFQNGVQQPTSAGGAGIDGPDPLSKDYASYNALNTAAALAPASSVPSALQGLPGTFTGISTALKDPISSSTDVLSRSVSDTLSSLTKGFNFSGSDVPQLSTGDFTRMDRASGPAADLPPEPTGDFG